MVKTKFLSYVLLLGLIVIASVLFILACIFVSSSRETGIAWGICVGIIGGQVGLSIFRKHKIICIGLATIIYSLIVFSFMYSITNWMKPLPSAMKFILYSLSIIFSWEISQYIVGKIIPVKEIKTKAQQEKREQTQTASQEKASPNTNSPTI